MSQSNLQTVTTEEVLRIHALLVAEFERDGDPISPAGIKDLNLLESAVSRQYVGFGNTLKYPDPIGNAATLLYGICCDHAFHNGNKRTALVAMLAHLDKNKITLENTRHTELYDLVVNLAAHELVHKPDKRKREQPLQRATSDEEVQFVENWIRKRQRPVVRGERQILFRELRRLLEKHGYSLKNPKKNYIDVVRTEKKKKGLFSNDYVLIDKHIGNIGYPGEGAVVGIQAIKLVRTICRLREEDGCDSSSFYDNEAIVDTLINRYRTILRRLADT